MDYRPTIRPNLATAKGIGYGAAIGAGAMAFGGLAVRGGQKGWQKFKDWRQRRRTGK